MKYLLAILVMGAVGVGCAQAGAANIDALVKNYVAAVNANNKSAYMNTIHPKVREAMGKTDSSFMKMMTQKDLAKQIPAQYKVAIKELDPTQGLMFEGMMTYAVRPTHMVDIDYVKPDGTSVTAILQAKEENGNWYFVYPVPTAETMKKMKAGQQDQEAQKKQAETLYGSLQGPQKQAILDTVTKEGKIAAMKAFRDEHEVGIYVAKLVVEKVLEAAK